MNMDNLIELRKDLGLTQEEMGKIVGVSYSTYSNYENYHTVIPLKRINIISNKYNKSLDFLLGFSRTNADNFNHVDIDYHNIGKRLKELRLSYNLSIRQFADKLKISKTAVDCYETGKIKVTAPVLISYAKLCNKSIDWLCCKK